MIKEYEVIIFQVSVAFLHDPCLFVFFAQDKFEFEALQIVQTLLHSFVHNCFHLSTKVEQSCH